MRDDQLFVDGWLEHAARVLPHKLALVCGPRRLTFAELAVRSARVANVWRAFGVARGERVAVLASNGMESAELLFGGARAGVVTVPLNFRLTAHEVGAILASARARVLVARERHRAIVEGVVAAGFAGRVLWLEGDYETALAQAGSSGDVSSAAIDIVRSPGDPFLQIYTSGTTGRPKGVMISHRNVAAFAWTNEAEGSVRRDDVHVIATPVCFGAPAARLLMNVHVGATSVVTADFDADALLTLLRGGEVSTFMVVPAMLRTLNERVSEREPVTSPRLRLAMYGGAPMPPDVIAAARARFRCGFYQGYGLTETLTVTTLRPEDHEGDGGAAHLARLGSVGRPAIGVATRLVDDDGREVALDEVGEIAVKCGSVMEGYHDDDAATAAVIRDGWAYTGDLARRDEHGFLTIVGRKKDMLVSGGINVYPREIELALESHPDVAEAAVVGVADEKWGEVPIAFVVLAATNAATTGATNTVDNIAAHAKERLAKFKHPRTVHIVEALPKNASGKVLKHELARHLEQEPKKARLT